MRASFRVVAVFASVALIALASPRACCKSVGAGLVPARTSGARNVEFRDAKRAGTSPAPTVITRGGVLKQRGASTAQTRLRVSRDGRSISFVERGRSYVLALGDKVGAARIEAVKLLLVTRRGEFTYLLIDVCGASKRRPDDMTACLCRWRTCASGCLKRSATTPRGRRKG